MQKVIIILILICLSTIGAAGYFWLKLQSQPLQSQSLQVQQPAVAQASIPSVAPVFVTLQPFTVSLPTVRNGYEVNKILYVGMVLRVSSEAQKTTLTQYLPEVRSSVLLLLSNQSIDDLEEEAGKLQLRDLVRQVLSRQYSPTEIVKVDDVFFTDFIIR